MIAEDDTSLASSSFKSIPDSSLASATFTSVNITSGQNSTAYKSLLSNTLDNSEASFDVLDSSKTEVVNQSEQPYNSANVGSSNMMSSKSRSILENSKSNVESASQNLFSSGQVQRKRSITNEKAPLRNRQDSTGSDIVVLKRQTSQGESDITLLSNPSQSSIAVIEQEPACPENNNLIRMCNLLCLQSQGKHCQGAPPLVRYKLSWSQVRVMQI